MKKAFTLLELVFVIVVIGILAALVLPRIKTNPVQEAAIDLLSKIRYTQHLALIDDKYESNIAWYKNRWQIKFNTNTNRYSIISNVTYAVNPSNASTNFSDIDLKQKYDVTLSVNGTECGVVNAANANTYAIGFDYVGRPFTGDFNTFTETYTGTDVRLVKTNDCAIVLTNGNQTATINITPETGYARLTF